MQDYVFERTKTGQMRAQVGLKRHALLQNPLLNKGTAFSKDERHRFELEGILPPVVSGMEQQARRAYEHICRKQDPLERYIGLEALQDRNETLFYRVLSSHLEEFMPIVYTPTVGEACKQYSYIYRRPRGMWITPADRGRIDSVLANAPSKDIRLIVVTDNERILGLGDQGAGGIGIPIGKLALYTAAAGIHPYYTLPVSLDVGTDNEELLSNELYIGYRHRRLRGEEYHALVEEFVAAVQQQFPGALLQWEDFKKQNAFDLLERFRERILSFNDDIQGTAAVALAAVLAASRAMAIPLQDQKVVILGAGAAGIGIARQLRDALSRAGLQGDTLIRAVTVMDSQGVLVDGREIRDVYKREFAWPKELASSIGIPSDGRVSLLEIIRAQRPTVLIGTTGTPGAFSKDVVEAMASATPKPAIFPFSNPTANSEGKPQEIIEWTKGAALVATGSPFPTVSFGGQTIRVGQGNNVYVFPGVGLGALVSRATKVTDSMFTAAAQAIMEQVTDADLAEGALFPRLNELRSITRRVAVAVCREARELGVGRALSDTQFDELVADEMWEPTYPTLEKG